MYNNFYLSNINCEKKVKTMKGLIVEIFSFDH